MMNQNNQMNHQNNLQVPNRDLEIVSENLKRIMFEVEEAKAKYRKNDDNVQIMAVTKTVEAQTVNYVIEKGIKLLGENRVQEYLDKKDIYLPCCDVHFIGHLQTNKVKFIAESVSCIQSLDSTRLAVEIDKQCAKIGKVMPVLIEVNAGNELSKGGVSPDEAYEFACECADFKNISVQGLMAIPPINADEAIYEKIHSLYLDIMGKNVDNINMTTLSIGMSGDYLIAIKHGANLVRIGSKLFGARKYMEVK